MDAHIPGAYFAHLDEDLSGDILPGITGRHPLPEDFDVFATKLGNWGIDSSKQVIVYDQSHGGIASRLWWMLNYLGHENVAVLDGGWKKWIEENREVTQVIPDDQQIKFEYEKQDNWIELMDEVRRWISDPSKQVVDARAAIRYAGIEEPIDPVAGHMPGAVNYPFLENVDEEHQWKSKQDLHKRFAKLFNKFDADDMIVHCGSGVTACHNLLAMKHAGYQMPKLYPGSWSEWITQAENPVESAKTETPES